jgi:hypothetical protein
MKEVSLFDKRPLIDFIFDNTYNINNKINHSVKSKCNKYCEYQFPRECDYCKNCLCKNVDLNICSFFYCTRDFKNINLILKILKDKRLITSINNLRNDSYFISNLCSLIVRNLIVINKIEEI